MVFQPVTTVRLSGNTSLASTIRVKKLGTPGFADDWDAPVASKLTMTN